MPCGITWPRRLIQIGSMHSTIKEVITSSLEVKHLMDGRINGDVMCARWEMLLVSRVRLEKGNFIWLLRPVWRGGVSRSGQIIGAECCTGVGSACWSPLNKNPQGGVVIPTPCSPRWTTAGSFLRTSTKVSLMILSSKKLPELWDYFLIYITGALEFNPDCKDIDLGLFPLRMNPTIKNR